MRMFHGWFAPAALSVCCAFAPVGPTGIATGQCVPSNVGSFYGTGLPGPPNGIALAGNLAYLVAAGPRGDGLAVLDVSDPAHPIVVGNLDFFTFSGLITGVAVSGNYAYMSVQFLGLLVIDVSDPANPAHVGNVGPGANGVAVSGTVAYMATPTTGLNVVDVSSPTSPLILGSTNTAAANAVVVSGSTAYIAQGSAGLLIVDVSNPAAPAVLGSVDTPGNARDVAVSGTVACVADDNAGLQVIDVSNPAVPAIVGSVTPLSSLSRVAMSGTLAYVGIESPIAGFYVVDVSNPAVPVVVGSVGLPTAWATHDLAVSGHRVFFAHFDISPAFTELRVFDVANCHLGACCVDGVCVERLGETTCQALGGTFLGANSTCAGSPACAPSCPGDIIRNGVVDVVDLLALLGSWGACP